MSDKKIGGWRNNSKKAATTNDEQKQQKEDVSDLHKRVLSLDGPGVKEAARVLDLCSGDPLMMAIMEERVSQWEAEQKQKQGQNSAEHGEDEKKKQQQQEAISGSDDDDSNLSNSGRGAFV